MCAQLAPVVGRAAAGAGPRRAVALIARGCGIALVVVIGLVTEIGWLYVLRGLGWLRDGPAVHDASPLLQLPDTTLSHSRVLWSPR